MKDMVCKVSDNDTQRGMIDILQPVFGIPRFLLRLYLTQVEVLQLCYITTYCHDHTYLLHMGVFLRPAGRKSNGIFQKSMLKQKAD